MNKFFTKDRLRVIFSVALSFLVCLGLFFTTICTDLLIFSNPKTVLAVAQKSNYSEIAVAQLTEELNDLAIPSGLPDDFFSGKVDKNEFESLFLDVTKNTITANNDYKLSLEKFKTQVLNLVTDYSKNEVGDFSSEVEKDIESFAGECENIYLSYVNPSLTSYVLTLLSSARKYVNIAFAISVIFVLITGVVLFKLNRVGAFIKYCFTAFGGTALAVGIIPLYLIVSKEIYRISISSKSLYAIATTFAEHFLWIMLISAVVLALVAFILLLIKIFVLIFRK